MDTSTADIFGNQGGGLDVSTEALEARWEPEGNAIHEADAARDGEGDDEGDDEVVEPEGDEVPPADADKEAPAVDDDAPEFTLPEDLAAKTPEELAKMVIDSQTEVGRQSGEVGELRSALQQMQEQFEQYNAAQQQTQQQQTQQQFQTEAVSMLDGDPRIAYNQALELLDVGLIPVTVMDEIITAAYDAELPEARKIERDWFMRMSRAEAGQALQAQTQQTQQALAPIQQSARQAEMMSGSQAVYAAHPEDAPAYEKDVARILQTPETAFEKGLAEAAKAAQSAPQFKAALEDALVYARGKDVTRSAAYTKNLSDAKAAAVVEMGGKAPGAAQAMTDEEKYKAAVFTKTDNDKMSALGF